MTRAELIEEVVRLYFEGVHAHEAISKVKKLIKEQVKGEKLNGICKVSDTSNEDKGAV